MRGIDVLHLSKGNNVNIAEDVVIRGINGAAKNVVIGDNVYIGKGVEIICDDFKIGDYGKIHKYTTIHGYNHCHIGHNAWIGQFSIIDSIGGTTIGDNCGIGAHSQLWSHIKYGDVLEGCQYDSNKPLIIGNDVWFVGHCIVSPITAKDKSMALVGSVITKDMEENTIYAGCPAVDTGRKQFVDKPIGQRGAQMDYHIKQSGARNIVIVVNKSEVNWENDLSYFVLNDRKYKKTGSQEEIKFMKYLLPEKAKFTPYE